MKKLFAGILTAALVLSAGTMNAFAAGHGCHYNYTDANGDGVCDFANENCAFVDDIGDGICDLVHTACGFIDENEDGVCDHCGLGYEESCHGGAACRPAATVRAGHHGRGRGCGRRCR